MQWGTDGLLVWLIITSISIIDLERAMCKQMRCLGLIGRKITRPFKQTLFRLLLLLPLQDKGMITLKLFLAVPKSLSLLIPLSMTILREFVYPFLSQKSNQTWTALVVLTLHGIQNV